MTTITTTAKGKSKMTFDQALDQAMGLHKEGVAFEEIAKTLDANGYRSEKTGKPVTGQTVRWMINKKLGKLPPSQSGSGAVAARGRKSKAPVVEVSKGPKGDLLELAKVILNQESLSTDVRLDALCDIFTKARRANNEVTPPTN